MSTIRNKDKWDSLSMKEKSDMMKVAVQQGIYNLSDIRKAYNEYAEGGDTEKEYYAGTLPEVEISTPRIDSYIAQPSSTYTAPYISEFPDIRFIGSRYDRDTLTDKGGKPADDISYKERWERQKRERTIEDWKNLGRGFSNTVGTAIDLASLIYGGGWAATRLLKGNKASSIGQKFAKYVLPSNAADNIGDVADFMIDPSVSKAAELGAGVALGQWRDFGNAYRQASELGSQALNVYNTTSDYTKGKTFAEGGPTEEDRVLDLSDRGYKSKEDLKITGTPPLVGIGPRVAKIAEKATDLNNEALYTLYNTTENLGKWIVGKMPDKYKTAIGELYNALKQNAVGTRPKEGSDFGARLPAFMQRVVDSVNDEKAYGGPLVDLANRYY